MASFPFVFIHNAIYGFTIKLEDFERHVIFECSLCIIFATKYLMALITVKILEKVVASKREINKRFIPQASAMSFLQNIGGNCHEAALNRFAFYFPDVHYI